MKPLSRRDFVKGAGLAAAAAIPSRMVGQDPGGAGTRPIGGVSALDDSGGRPR